MTARALPIRRVLVSCSDKSGIVSLLKPWADQGVEIVSTGGTLSHLRENGVRARDVSDVTGFPEVMGGRVKTLHPKIHMPLLARSDVADDFALLELQGTPPFDLVIVNLYPFREAFESGKKGKALIEKIDVGGPTMLRAAAKNHERITVICDPKDYAHLEGKAEQPPLETRRELAAKVFAHTSAYDALIARALGATDEVPAADSYPPQLILSARRVRSLRYGENPHQKAAWYALDDRPEKGLEEARILHGKELSYNNLLDIESAALAVAEFESPAAVVVKHNNPCGAAEAQTLSLAVQRALQADPVSVFGGIVAANRPVDVEAATALSGIFLECVVAPSFTEEALAILTRKKDLRVLEWPEIALAPQDKELHSVRSIRGGFLIQDADRVRGWSDEWQILGTTPMDGLKNDLLFAWQICAHLRSNAIAIAAGGRSIGLGMGQVNRVDAVDQAIERMRRFHGDVENPVLASDAFFPFPDSIERAAAAGIKYIIQPGGSVRDREVIERARGLEINLVLTGTRHFRH